MNIHSLVKVPTNSYNFLLTAICASPNFNKRKILWNYLKELSPYVNMPWVLLGDFNDLLAKDEKFWGGGGVGGMRLETVINCCGLMDLGFHGPEFTWTNKNPIWHQNIRERLDRGLGNIKTHHLPRTKSDHCPILLESKPPTYKSTKPFKFEQMWLTNPSFSTLVENNWNSSAFIPSSSSPISRLQHCLKFLTTNIIDWNKNNFGNLFRKKNCLLARLRGIQIALACKPLAYLYSLEHQPILDYNHILHQEFLF